MSGLFASWWLRFGLVTRKLTRFWIEGAFCCEHDNVLHYTIQLTQKCCLMRFCTLLTPCFVVHFGLVEIVHTHPPSASRYRQGWATWFWVICQNFPVITPQTLRVREWPTFSLTSRSTRFWVWGEKSVTYMHLVSLWEYQLVKISLRVTHSHYSLHLLFRCWSDGRAFVNVSAIVIFCWTLTWFLCWWYEQDANKWKHIFDQFRKYCCLRCEFGTITLTHDNDKKHDGFLRITGGMS